MRGLVYGFAPFGGKATNISADVVESITVESWPMIALTKKIFRVRFDTLPFIKAAEEAKPDFILGLGQYPRGKVMRLEQQAVNEKRERGVIRPIHIDGPIYRRVNWRIPSKEGVVVTEDAGKFVCNFSMYTLIPWAEANHCRFAFIHIPKVVGVEKSVAFVQQVLSVEVEALAAVDCS